MQEIITYGSVTGSCLENNGAFSIGVGTITDYKTLLNLPDVSKHLEHGDGLTLWLETYFKGGLLPVLRRNYQLAASKKEVL